MFMPWRPIPDDDLDMPRLSISTRATSLQIHWRPTWKNAPCFDIVFAKGLASLLVLDESTFASFKSDLWPTAPGRFAPSPRQGQSWHAWREEDPQRRDHYGDLGRLNYQQVTSYLFTGGDIVLLVDIGDCLPVVELLPPNKSLERTR
jgi:hypothetical protein